MRSGVFRLAFAALLCLQVMTPLVVAPWAMAKADKGQRARDHEAYRLVQEAMQLVKVHKEADAVAVFQQAAALDPNMNSHAIHVNLGNVYTHLGEPDRAVAEYKKALSFKPGSPLSMFNLAMAYQEVGNIPEAIRWYEKYLQTHPTGESAERVVKVLKVLKTRGANLVHGDPEAPDYYAVVSENGVSRWPAETLPIKVFIVADSNVPGYRESFPKALRDALDAWCEASGGRLSWQEVDAREKADLVCLWTNNRSEVAAGGNSMEAGRTIVSTSRGAEGERLIRRVTITICTVPLDEALKDYPDDAMKRVCLHEVGHGLGMRGHSSNNKDVMFFMRTYTIPLTPSARDRATIQKLYQAFPGGSPANSQ